MGIECNDRSFEYQKLKKERTNKYYYQIELAKDIKEKLLDSDKTSGMLVLPTGGGKTRVAVTTALDIAIKDNYKILWIAHRHMLLEQAAKTFCEFSKLSDKNISIRMISGKHETIEAIDTTDDIIIISNLSMGVREKTDRKSKLTLKERVFTKNQKWLVIVDEAHHALAKSYKEWIGIETHGNNGWLRKYRKNNIKILGLTATPNFIVENSINHYDDNRTKELSSLFDNNMIGSISTQKLIDKEILSRPNFITIDTNLNFDTEELLSEVENIKPALKNSLLETFLNEKISDHEERNQLIVKTYMNGYKNVNFKKGQTLVFASNIFNAKVLKIAFNKQGIDAEVIHSGNSHNDNIIANFRNGKIKVLINVQILTEGSDIPEIENVFISRITHSKVLYRQMVGRGLRGAESGGTKTANIVTFKDNILNYHDDFFNVQNLNSGLFDEQEFEIISQIEAEKTLISDDDILRVYEKFTGLLDGNQDIPLIAAIPIGYYDLNEENKKIQVYEHQLKSYEHFIKSIEENIHILNEQSQAIMKKYFNSDNMLFDVVESDLIELINYIKKVETPQFITHEFKNNLINELEKIASSSTDSLIWEKEYDKSQYAKEFYTISDYIKECSEISRSLRYGSTPLKTIELADEDSLNYQFDATAHNKEEIFKRASEKVCHVLGKEKLEFSPNSFEWSKKAYKSYWGVATYFADGMSSREKKGNTTKIVINKQLQLKGLPSEVIESVVYHELLHTEMKNYTHDEQFRVAEAKFPNFAYCEHILYKLSHATIENLGNCVLEQETNVEKQEYSWKLYNKRGKTSHQIKKFLDEGIKLPTQSQMKELFKDENFKKTLPKNKKLFLCNDRKTSFDFEKGLICKNPTFHYRNGYKGKVSTKSLHLLVEEVDTGAVNE